MNEENKKSGLHVHLGGFIIIIIIIIILFKVDIKSKIDSPQFQKNINYIEEGVKNIWVDKVLKPLKKKTIEWFVDTGNQKIEQIQYNFNEGILKMPNSEDINKHGN
jgi:hypothetical protein